MNEEYCTCSYFVNNWYSSILFSSFEAYIFCFLTGVFLDVDHLVDYLWWSEERSLKKFFFLGPGYFNNPHPTDRFLHSVDLFILLITPVMLYWPILGIGVIMGFIGHLILDFAGFGFSPLDFFLLYRVFVWKRKILTLREKVLRKDGFKCRDCGATSKLQIHRDTKLGRFNGWERAEEWTTVCEQCHIQRHKTGMLY